MPEFTFESLQKRVDTVIAGFCNDPEAWFMWNALAIVRTAPDYTHLTLEEVFEHLRAGIRPMQPGTKKKILQLVKELEAKDEDTAHNSRCRGVTTNRPCGRR